MLSGIISSIGLTNLVLIIVGVSLLIVVVLLMSYFRVLITIANFAYPNAKFRAHGNPFIKREEVEPLVESRNINEVFSAIREKNYELPKEATEDIDEVEKALEEDNLRHLKKAYSASPQNTKEFVDAWLARYDAKMVKRAVKAVSRGAEKQEIKDRLYPVKIVDEQLIDDISSSRNLQELMTVLNETQFREAFKGREWENTSFFELDIELDRFAFDRLKKALMKMGTEEKTPLKYFFGRYTDIMNLKIVFRGLREDFPEDRLKDALLPSGRELEEWKLENMIESSNLEEALVELEGTSYEDIRNEAPHMSDFDIERYLDEAFLSLVSEILSQHILTVGPMLKYLVGKELELRNMKILVRGQAEGLDPEDIRGMVIMEAH